MAVSVILCIKLIKCLHDVLATSKAADTDVQLLAVRMIQMEN
jgi:hypothetical protein